jgi:hypothetical protein
MKVRETLFLNHERHVPEYPCGCRTNMAKAWILFAE